MKDSIKVFIEGLDLNDIPDARLTILNELVSYLQLCNSEAKTCRLNFICTHNSRRSQFSQLWCWAMSVYFNVTVESFSGGTAVTACNERTIASLKRFGFDIHSTDGENPVYTVSVTDQNQIMLYSKLFDAKENPTEDFAAVMTCSDADENCPFIPGCDKRIPLRYEDPKAFDDTELEDEMYDARSVQIAREMKYVFTKLTENE